MECMRAPFISVVEEARCGRPSPDVWLHREHTMMLFHANKTSETVKRTVFYACVAELKVISRRDAATKGVLSRRPRPRLFLGLYPQVCYGNHTLRLNQCAKCELDAFFCCFGGSVTGFRINRSHFCGVWNICQPGFRTWTTLFECYFHLFYIYCKRFAQISRFWVKNKQIKIFS